MHVASQDDTRKEEQKEEMDRGRAVMGDNRNKARPPKKTVRGRGNQSEELWEWNTLGEGKI